MRRVGTCLALLAFVVAACSGVAAPSSAPSITAATEPPAAGAGTTAPTEGPETTEPPAAPCDTSGATPCALPAGPYATAAFTLTMPAGWVKWTETAEGGELYPSVNATGGIHWMVNPHVPADPSNKPATATDIRAAMATLFADATPSQVTATKLGGKAVEMFDLALGDNDPTEYLAVDSSNFRLGPGEKVRFVVAKRGADTIVIVLDAFSSADFDDVVALTKPLLDSLVWA